MFLKFFAVLLTLVGCSLMLISRMRWARVDGYHVLARINPSASAGAGRDVIVINPKSGVAVHLSKEKFHRIMSNDPYWYEDAAGINAELGRRYMSGQLFFIGFWLTAVSLTFWGLHFRRKARLKVASRKCLPDVAAS